MVVTVACICYNQAPYIKDTVFSVLSQTHQDLDIWVLDDGSTDGSQVIIESLKEKYPELNIYLSPENIGHTRLFNKMLPEFRGEAIIDLATDDLLLPERVEEGLRVFRENPTCGVHYTNAEIIDEHDKHVAFQYPINAEGETWHKLPCGDVFKELVGSYIINPATMMIRSWVFEELKGYDATLSYEDFDFWVRSSRYFAYCYSNKVLVKKRDHPGNYSKQQYTHGSIQMMDTYRVCRKIPPLIRNKAERKAFRKRVRSEMRQCLKHGNLRLYFKYLLQL